MSKIMRKRAAMLLIVALLSACLLAAPAAAEPVTYVNTSPFVDVSTSHWAISSIIEMYLRGVVVGYSDGSFLPDSPVKQIEAILMAVRSMGEIDTIKAIDSSRELTVKVPDWVTQSYKREMLFAVDQGLLTPAENNFDAESNATRAWMAQLIVRMAGKGDEAAAAGSGNTGFTDNGDIPSGALPYVNVAVKQGLIKGYADGSFGPNKNVTRAETATMFTRTDTMIAALADSIVAGTITAINSDLFTISVGRTSMKLTMLPTTWGFDRQGAVLSWSKFTADTYVKLLLNGTQATLIQEIEAPKETTPPPKDEDDDTTTTKPTATARNVKGTIRSIIEADRILIYADSAGQLITEQLGPGVTLTNVNDSPIAFNQLLAGGSIEVGYDKNNHVLAVQMMSATGSYGGDGYIYSIDEKEQLIIIKDVNGIFTTYEYADNVVVTIPNVRFPAVSALKTGDLVSLTIKNNVLTELELVEAQQQLSLTGEIVSISTNNNNVSIKSGTGSALYYLDKNATIEIDGLNVATIYDLREGDSVTAQINNGQITALEVLDRDAGSYYSGTVLAVDTTNQRIVIKAVNNETMSYDLSANVSVEIDGHYEDITDIAVDMEVDLTVVDDKVLYIEVASGAEGKVISLNTSRNLISVQLSNGSTDSYVYSDEVDINMATVSNADEYDIVVGDTVRVHTNVDGLVYEIDVYCSGMYEVVTVSESSERVKVEDERGKSRYLYLDESGLTIEMPGVRRPTVKDFKVGDVLEVTFRGTDARHIVVMETVTGTITTINDITGVFAITDYDGISHSFTFTSKSTVTDNSKTSSKITAIAVGDRVQVYENLNKDLEISLMTLVTGTVNSVDSDYERVYIQKTGTNSYVFYYCDDSCLLTEDGNELAWRELAMNDKVRLYVIGNTAYEIERYK